MIITSTRVKLQKRTVNKSFKFGEGKPFGSKVQYEIPFPVKNTEGVNEIVKMKACILNKDIPFLCGKDTMRELNMVVNLVKSAQGFS